MSATPVENNPTPVEPPKGQEPSTAVTTPPEAPTTEAPKAEAKGNVWDDPAAAQAEIERLRRENAKDRTNAKAQAAEDARKELAQTIGKALGIVEDDAEVDPVRLTESLTTAQADAKQARIDLAVYKASPEAGGNPAALLDSKSFSKTLEGIDPSDTDAIKEAIAKAVAADPRLGAAPAEPQAPKPPRAQGSSATGAPTPEELAAQAAASGDWAAAMALKATQLTTLPPTGG